MPLLDISDSDTYLLLIALCYDNERGIRPLIFKKCPYRPDRKFRIDVTRTEIDNGHRQASLRHHQPSEVSIMSKNGTTFGGCLSNQFSIRTPLLPTFFHVENVTSLLPQK